MVNLINLNFVFIIFGISQWWAH